MRKIAERTKKLAVATYKREDYALTLLKNLEFDKYCVCMYGADNNIILTKADIVNLIYDAIGAERAGIIFIAVTYGFGFKGTGNVTYRNIGIAGCVEKIYKFIN